MIVYDPKLFIKKFAPDRTIKKLLSRNISLKRTALSFVENAPYIDKNQVRTVALKAIKNYKKRLGVAAETSEAAKAELVTGIVEDPALLIQRVKNDLVWQVHEKIKTKYAGQRAIWTPSSANEPRPEHQLHYGKEYTIGEGIDGVEPGDEPGCQCGMQILTSDTTLEFE